MNFQTANLPKKNSEENVPITVINNLEALQVLSLSLLREVEALKSNSFTENQAFEEIKQGNLDLDREIQKFETELIRCALIRTGGIQRKAAKLLNVKISTLNAKIKRLGIPTDSFLYSQG